MRKEMILFTPGVLRVSPRVWSAAFERQYSHREPEIIQRVKKSKENLRNIFGWGDEYEIVYLSSTGRGAVEASVSTVLATYQRVLFIIGGKWSRFMSEIAKKYLPTIEIFQNDFFSPIDIKKLEEKISQVKPECICFTSHETETGLLQPTEDILQLAHQYHSKIMIDIMSSIVVDKKNWAKLGVDIVAFSAAKGIRSLTGIGIVVAKKSFLKEALHSQNHYLDLKAEYEYQQTYILPRTPLPPESVAALSEATEELHEEGLFSRQKDIEEKMNFIKDWVLRTELESTTELQYVGNFSLPLRLPKEWNYQSFIKELERYGYFVLYGHEGIEGNTFEISPVGYLTWEEIKKFTNALENIFWGQ